MKNNSEDVFKDSPAKYFRLAVREIKERIKLCEEISTNMEDLADIENSFGNSLVKLGRQSVTLSARTDQPAIALNNLWDNVFTMCEKLGKQHIGFSICISQSIGKTFTKFSNEHRNNVKEIVDHIQEIADDLKKSRKTYKKNYEKYVKIGQDIENCILSRNASMKEVSERITDPSEDGFINRSLTMMLGKSNTSDTIKKMHDKYKELSNEFEITEKALIESAAESNNTRNTLREALQKAVIKLEEMEVSRLTFIQEGLTRFCQSGEGMLEHIEQLMHDLKHQLTHLMNKNGEIDIISKDIDAEIPSTESLKWKDTVFIPDIDSTSTSPSSTMTSNIITNINNNNITGITTFTSSTSGSMTKDMIETAELFVKLDKLRVFLKMLRNNTKHALQIMSEISDTERTYSKSSQIVFERYGYPRHVATLTPLSPTSAFRNERGNSTSSINNNNNNTAAATVTTLSCAELVSLIEAPYTRRGWDMAVRAFCGFSDAHMKVAEVYSDSCRSTAEATHKRLVVDKKNVKDRQISSGKKLEVARSSLSKLLVKMSRVRRELKERRIALKKLREQEAGIAGEGASDTPAPNTSTNINSNISDPTSTSSSVSSTATSDLLDIHSTSLSTASTSEYDIALKKSEKEKASNSNSSSSVLQGLQSLENLGNVLGAVVGLESVSDRTLRLENRITQLEEEEIACMESLVAMQTSVAVLQQSARQDMILTIESSKTALHNAISNIIRINIQIQETQIQSVFMSRKVIYEVRVCLEEMRLESDINFFANIIRSSAELPSNSTDKAVAQELPPDIAFIPFRSDIIDKERKKERHISTTSLSNTSSSSSSSSNNSNNSSRLINNSNSNSNSNINNKLIPKIPTSPVLLAPLSVAPAAIITADTNKIEPFTATTNINNTIGISSTPVVKVGRSTTSSTSTTAAFTSTSQKVNNQMDMMTSVTSSAATTTNGNDDSDLKQSPTIPRAASASPPTRPQSLSLPSINNSSNLNGNKHFSSPSSSFTMTTPIAQTKLSTKEINNISNSQKVVSLSPTSFEKKRIVASSIEDSSIEIIGEVIDENTEEEADDEDDDEEDNLEANESNNSDSDSDSESDDEDDEKYKISAPTEESVIMNIDEYSHEDVSSLKLTSSSYLMRTPLPPSIPSPTPSMNKISNSNGIESSNTNNAVSINYSELTSSDFSQPLYAVAASVGITLPWSTTPVAGYPNSTSTTTSSSIPPPLPVQESPFAQELARFNLSSSDKVLEFFSCALYPKRGMLTHGRLFITQQYLAFSGWPETRLLLSLQQIAIVEKTSIFFVPSALLVTTAVGEEYYFGSFLDRDQCYTLLTCMIQIAKSLVKVEVGINLHDEARTTDITSSSMSPIDSSISIIGNNMHSSPLPSHQSTTSLNITSSHLKYEAAENDGIDVTNIFTNFGISLLGEHTYTHPLALLDVWKHYWQHCHGHQSFLDSEGDFEINYSEWAPLETRTVLKDVCALPFTYSRKINYLHPRTSMLMFGPKNAPSNQIQYLYLLPAKLVTNTLTISTSVSASESLSHNLTTSTTVTDTNTTSTVFCMDEILPYHFVVLTVTQFDGIPLSDTFKVLQYFTFTPSPPTTSSPNNAMNHHCHCVAKVGAKVHFVKPTIMKARVTSGVEEELSVLTRKWINFSEKMVLQKRSDEPSSQPNKTELGIVASTLNDERRGDVVTGGSLISPTSKYNNNIPITTNMTINDGNSSDRPFVSRNTIHAGNTGQLERSGIFILLLFLMLIFILQYYYYSDLNVRIQRLEDQLAKLLPEIASNATTRENSYQNIITAYQTDVSSSISFLTEELTKLSKYLYTAKNEEL